MAAIFSHKHKATNGQTVRSNLAAILSVGPVGTLFKLECAELGSACCRISSGESSF
jgi:hypothetical protein